jgi:threonine/homoserine/homoserine lactone efflux protein
MRQILSRQRHPAPEVASGCRAVAPSVEDVSLTYVLTATGMILVPGPDVLLLTGRALQRGAGPAVRTLTGTIAGYLVITAVVAAGLGAALAGWEPLIGGLHVAAVGYLLWLALGAWRTAGTGTGDAPAGARGDWRDGFLTAALNPRACCSSSR